MQLKLVFFPEYDCFGHIELLAYSENDNSEEKISSIIALGRLFDRQDDDQTLRSFKITSSYYAKQTLAKLAPENIISFETSRTYVEFLAFVTQQSRKWGCGIGSSCSDAVKEGLEFCGINFHFGCQHYTNSFLMNVLCLASCAGWPCIPLCLCFPSDIYIVCGPRTFPFEVSTPREIFNFVKENVASNTHVNQPQILEADHSNRPRP